MDLELKHIGQTLAVGGFTLFGLFQLISLFRPSVTSWLALHSTGQKLHESAMILAIVFAFGILVEDVSKNIVAERSRLSKFVNYVIDKDRQLRLDSLFEVKAFSDEEATIKSEPIYTDMMSIQHSDLVFKQHSEEIKKLISSTMCNIDGYIKLERPNALVEEINRIYYSAITRVYHETNYYQELQGIQYRADFSRSLTFICMFYAALYFMLGVLSFLPGKLTVESVPEQLGFFDQPRRYRPRQRTFKWYPIQKVRAKRGIILLMLVLYLLGILFAKTSYKSEMTNYNLRVFGYYTSLVKTGVK